MKKLFAALAMLTIVFAANARDTYSRNVNDLPKGAQATLTKNFKSKVSVIKIEKELGRISEYDVVMTDGSEISFDRDGNWKDVEVSKSSSVPAGFIPTAIANHVKQNHKKAKIVGIEKDRKGYDVELSDGLDLKFDKQGKFLRYDD